MMKYRSLHDWVWIMFEIGEKPGFMKVRAVTVCAKAGIGRKAGHKNRAFMQIFG